MSETVLPLNGVIAATITPLGEDGQVDQESFHRHIDDLLTAGVDGLFVAGTTGEGLLLNLDERVELVRIASRVAGGRVPVVGHCGALRTTDAAWLARRMRDVGASGVAAVTPFFYHLDTEAVVRHFMRIVGAAECPTYLYSIPANAGVPLPLAVVEAMCEHAFFGGVKYSGCDISLVRRYASLGVDVLIGCDSRIVEALSAGAVGTISGTAACFPQIFVDLFRMIRLGEETSLLQQRITRVDQFFETLPPVAGYKTVLYHRGVISTPRVRDPLRSLRPDEEEQVVSLLSEVRM